MRLLTGVFPDGAEFGARFLRLIVRTSASGLLTGGLAPRLMETIYAGFDQYESDMNGYRTSAAMRENARRGFVNGSAAPYGYAAKLVDTGAGPKRRKLSPNPEEVPIVQELFQLYIALGGAKAVARD
jgi:site-specific DNA recombinase